MIYALIIILYSLSVYHLSFSFGQVRFYFNVVSLRTFQDCPLLLLLFFSGIFHAVLFSFFFFLAGVVVSLLVAEIVCATNELYFVLIS